MTVVALGFMAASILAQSNLLVSGPAAMRAVSNGEISADAAAKVAQGCIDFATKNNFVAAVVVLDPDGNVVHSHRMDGIRPDEIETALNRARAAAWNRNATNTVPNPTANVTAAVRGNFVRDFDPSPGGVAIFVDDQIVGAVGVAGSDSMNADCARAGIAAVPGLKPPTPPAGRGGAAGAGAAGAGGAGGGR